MLAAIESIRTLLKRGNLLDRSARFQSGVAKLAIKIFDLVIKACDRDLISRGPRIRRRRSDPEADGLRL